MGELLCSAGKEALSVFSARLGRYMEQPYAYMVRKEQPLSGAEWEKSAGADGQAILKAYRGK